MSIDLIQVQLLANSGVFVYLMVRYATAIANHAKLTGSFIFAVFICNFLLMLDRCAFIDAAIRAFSISIGFFLGVLFVSKANKKPGGPSETK
jgi:hypothetical protein